MQDIFIIGVGMTPFGRMLDVDLKTMTRQATDAALNDAGIEKSDLNAAYFANVSQGHMERQHMIRGEIALRSMGIGGIPVMNVENACASGSSAFNSAVNLLSAFAFKSVRGSKLSHGRTLGRPCVGKPRRQVT